MTHNIPDLRSDYDQMSTIKDGVVYRKGNVVQVWWERDNLGRPFDNSPQALQTLFGNGRETWTFPDLANAQRCYDEMASDRLLRRSFHS